MFHFRFPSWSFDDLAQFELDTLEDIFKRSDWQDRALKPALSSILAPALCAVYGKRLVFTLAAFLGLQSRDEAGYIGGQNHANLSLNRPLPSCPKPLFQSEAKCKTFDI